MLDFIIYSVYIKVLIEVLYWVLVVLIIYRFNRDLHRNIHDDDQYYYVKSETTDWQGWVKRT